MNLDIEVYELSYELADNSSSVWVIIAKCAFITDAIVLAEYVYNEQGIESKVVKDDLIVWQSPKIS